ncbi:MAG TPA: translocation/assembly module TamB domain-containing protein [Bryobacteraceae bacterium]|nr:translocation/assembly module TamB domain-containing protein [Bryobacteraceae bacterium]
MSRRTKILRNIALGVTAVSVLLLMAGIAVVQTDWFRNYVKQQIISATEEATGGKVELGSFSFDWSHLHASVTDFVIHGKEAADAAPLVRAKRVEIRVRLFTSIKHLLDVAYLGVERPEANVIVYADGTTNVPTPKVKVKSDKTPLDSLVDLAVDRFELTNGTFTFNSRQKPFDVRGNNLRAQLFFNALSQSYKGELSLEPLYAVSGRNTPVTFRVLLPAVLERNRITIENARFTTSGSEIVINGSIDDLRKPVLAARINGHLLVADVKNLGDLPLTPETQGSLSTIRVDANAVVSENVIDVKALRLSLGASEVEASGKLKDASGAGGVEFKSRLALQELGRLAKLPQRPDGKVSLNGKLTLDANNNYTVDGNVEANHVSFSHGAQRFRNVNLFSAIHLDPHNLDLKGMRLSALGGSFSGDASLKDYARYKLRGKLHNLDVRSAARAAGQQELPYAGVVTGAVEAEGDLKAPGRQGLAARARLTVVPGKRGIPVSGRLNIDYAGATGSVNVTDSFLNLPHTRIALSGSPGKRLTFSLTSEDLSDLLAIIPAASRPAVQLNKGRASFTGELTGSLNAPRIVGHLAINQFTVQQRQFDALSLDLAASSANATITNGTLTRGPMQSTFTAAVGLKNWKPTPEQPLSANAILRDGDLADVLALAGKPNADSSGALTANAQITGTVGNPRGVANLQAVNGKIQGEAFDRIDARVNMADQRITIPSAYIAEGNAKVQLKAEFQHARDSFTTGRLHAEVKSENLNLSQLRTLQKQRPQTSGEIQLQAEVTADLQTVNTEGPAETAFRLISVTGDIAARNLRVEGQNYGNLTATARTTGQSVNYNLVSNFAGSNIRVNGDTQLLKDYPTNAAFTIGELPVERVLTLAKRTDVPVKGTLAASGRFTGTVSNLQVTADLDLTKAMIQDEPLDRVRGHIAYLTNSIEVSKLEVAAGPSKITLSARYEHPADNLQTGKLQFQATGGSIDLGRLRHVQKLRPGLTGAARIEASGNASIQEKDPRVLLSVLNANVAATAIALRGRNLGDLNLDAKTSGTRLDFSLTSNLAKADIQGRGNAELKGDYPVDAQLSFKNVTWGGLEPLLGARTNSAVTFDAAADGQLSVQGPVTKTNSLRGRVEISRLHLSASPAPGRKGREVRIQNQGPLSAKLDTGVVRIDNFHLAGPQTDIQITGAIPLEAQTFDLKIAANTNLALLQDFNRDIVSSGAIVLATTVRGTAKQPLVNGRLELRKASINHTDLPNGISNANGLVVFNGNSASIQNLTAETGGGTLTLGGFAAFRDSLRFGLRANTAKVRVRLQQGVSVVSSANLNMSGTRQSSVVSGTVTLDRLTYAPRSDFGSILTRAAPPVRSPQADSPILDNMKLDIRVRTSGATAVQASQAQNLQIDADLRVRGTAAQPGVLGQVAISEGKLVFFGSTYTVNSGTISFYNPLRIEPILNISLKTQAKGVEVVLNVTGPVDNMKLSYNSDPPLQFQEIVSLLASGKTPTSDPTLLANEPSQPAQTYQQMGQTQVLSKALADPVANQLQRVFGVSQLKIDPSFTGGSELPQARLTLQQQITSNLTFTYVTALNDPNTQIVRIEWALNPRWSAIAARDQNGIVSLNFFYKKQFR